MDEKYTQPSFSSLVKSDAHRWNANPSFLSYISLFLLQPGFQLSFSIRLQKLLGEIPIIGTLLKKIIWYITCITLSAHCSNKASYGRGLYFPHACAIVIGDGAVIGNNATIYQSTTIGTKTVEKEEYPTLGDNVQVYAGAQIIGAVNIGSNAIIGANAVVTKDIPENATAVGIPAKIINPRKET